MFCLETQRSDAAIICRYVIALILVTTTQLLEICACPLPCQCMEADTVMNCQYSSLTHIPSIAPSVIILDLDHNRISLLNNDSFSAPSSVEILSLQDNGMLHIESGAFHALYELRVVRLARNHLSSLPRNIFVNNRKLQVLDFHANYFAVLPDHVMYHLHSLQAINASFNQLISARLETGFRYTTQLNNIDLSGNDIVAVEEDDFKVMTFWDINQPRFLNLTRCNLRYIHPEALHPIPNLHTLSLSGNFHLSQDMLASALEDLPTRNLHEVDFSHVNVSDVHRFFEVFRPTSLRVLQMVGNHIRTIPKRSFFFLGNLRKFHLDFNEITSIDDLAGLSRLEFLSLSYNNMIELEPAIFEGLPELRELDLSHNMLPYVDDEPFLNLFNLHTIDISCNQIQRIKFIDGMESLETLLASRNRISSLQFLQRLRRLHTLDLSFNAIQKLNSDVFYEGQHLFHVNFSNNVISEIGEDTFKDSIHNVIDLSKNRLTVLNGTGWQDLKRLYLEDNSIYLVSRQAFHGLRGLEELRLERNDIKAFVRGTFNNLVTLRVLDLSHNPFGSSLEENTELFNPIRKLEILRLQKIGLQHLSSDLFNDLVLLKTLDLSHNQILNIDYSIFIVLSALDDLNLSHCELKDIDSSRMVHLRKVSNLELMGNSFHCNCDLGQHCDRLFSSKTSRPTRDNRTLYQCSSPAEWRSIPTADFCNSDRHCSELEKIVVCTAIVTATAIIILATVLAAWQCRVRENRRMTKLKYRFVDETSLASSSNSSNNSNNTKELLNPDLKQWL